MIGVANQLRLLASLNERALEVFELVLDRTGAPPSPSGYAHK